MRDTRTKNGISLLYNHGRDLLLGKLRDVTCGDDRVGRGVARFGRGADATEKWQDVQDEILTDVSVGYDIHFAKEIPAKELPKDLMEMAAREKLPVYRITDWEPFECSLVTVPADPTVGVGRTEGAGTESEAVPVAVVDIQVEKEMENTKMEVRVMDEKSKTVQEIEADLKVQTERAAKDATAAAQARVSGIYDLGARFSNFIPKFLVTKAVEEGMPLDEFQRMVLARVETGKPIDTPLAEIGLSNAEVKRYSITRAILSQWNGAKEQGVDSSFEMACHREVSKRIGQDPQKGGIFVPYEIMRQPATRGGTGQVPTNGQRDLTVGSGAGGGYLVGTDNLGSEFIDLLRNQMLIRRLGARVLTGLRGNVTIPKRTAGVTSYWVGEATAPTEGGNTYAQLALSPKNVGANLDYTRNLLLQSNPSVDGLVNGDLATSLALAVDLASFHGSGGSGQPQGVVGSSGVGSVTATTIDMAKAMEFLTDVAAGNALASNCAFVTTPAVAAICASRVKFASTASPMWVGNILETSDMMGFRGFSSNQITAGYMLFGDWSQVIIAEWGGLELVVDPYTQSKNGIIQVTAFQTIDVGVRYGGAFTLSTSVT